MNKSKNLNSYYISTEFGSPKFVKSDALAAVDAKPSTTKNVLSSNNYIISLSKEKRAYEFPMERDSLGSIEHLNSKSTKHVKITSDPKLVGSVKESLIELNLKMKQIQNEKSLAGLFGTKKMKANPKNRSSILDDFGISINEKITGAFRRIDPITNHTIKPARNFETIKQNLKRVATDSILKKVGSIPRIRNSPSKLAQIQSINESKPILTVETSPKLSKLGGLASTGILSPSNLHTSSLLSPDNIENHVKNKLVSVISSDMGGFVEDNATPANMKSLDLVDALRDAENELRLMPQSHQNTLSLRNKSPSEREERFLPGKRKRANPNERSKLDRFLQDQFVIDLIAKNKDKKHDDSEEKYPTVDELHRLVLEKKSVNDDKEFALPEYNFIEEYKKRQENPVFAEIEIPKGYQKMKGFEIFTPENSFYRDVAKGTSLMKGFDLSEVENVPKFKRSPRSMRTTIIPEVSVRKSSPKKTIVLKPGELPPVPDDKSRKMSIFEKLGSNRMKKLRKALREKLKLWTKANIPAGQRSFANLAKMVDGHFFNPQPYEHPGSQDFFQAVRIGDWKKVQAKLRNDRYIIYDYDHMGQSALHWAVKRGHALLVDRLLFYGAEIDAKDLMGKTPLYYAIKTSNVELAKVLLFNRASPHNEKIDYTSLCKDGRISKVLMKAKQLNVVLNFYKGDEKKKIWQKRSQEIFDADKLDDAMLLEEKSK